MLIEKYMDVEVKIPGREEDEYDIYHEQVEVSDDEIRHYIDTFLSAEDVLNYAKQIDPESFEGEYSSDLDFAYDLLVDEFDEHDDIEDIRELNEYIQECVQNDYEDEATEGVYDQIDIDETDERQRYWGLL